MGVITGYLGKATEHGREIIDTAEPKRVIRDPHYEIHAGTAFLTSWSGLVDTSDDIEILIVTPPGSVRAHMEMHFEAALASTVEIWQPSIMTDNATNRLTPINRFMDHANTSILTVCHTPSGTQTGTADILRYIGSASASGKTDVGGSASSRGEVILPSSSNILLRMTSRADGNALTIALDWYERALAEDVS